MAKHFQDNEAASKHCEQLDCDVDREAIGLLLCFV
jgi:hypothetical protein